MRCGPAPDENFARAIEFIRDAARKGAQIVCLPELFRSQYFCQIEDHKNFDLAEEVPGQSTAALGEVARETGTLISASLFERRSITHGKQFSVAMQSPMDATSPWRTASATKPLPVGTELNFGAKALCAGQTAKSLRKVRLITRRS